MKQRKLQSLLLILLVVAVVLSVMLLPGCRSSGLGVSGAAKLSELEDEALLRYIRESGMTFPQYVQPEDADDMRIIRTILRELEEDPNHEEPFLSGMDYWIDVYEDLRKVVKIYYGIED